MLSGQTHLSEKPSSPCVAMGQSPDLSHLIILILSLCCRAAVEEHQGICTRCPAHAW